MAQDTWIPFINSLLGIKTPQQKENASQPQVAPKLETIKQGLEDLRKGIWTITKDPWVGLSPKIAPQITPRQESTVLRDQGGLRVTQPNVTPSVSSTDRTTTGPTAVDKQLERLRAAQANAANIRTYDEQQADIDQNVADKNQQVSQQETIDAMNAVSDPLIKLDNSQAQTEDVVEPLQGNVISRAGKQFASIFSTLYDTAFIGKDVKELDRSLQRDLGYAQVNDRGRVQYVTDDERNEINQFLDKTFKQFEGDWETITKAFETYAKDKGLANTNVQDWIKYNNQFSEEANKLQEKVTTNLRSTDVEIYWEARIKEAERVSTPFDELSKAYTLQAQNDVKQALEAGTLPGVSLTDGYKRVQELSDVVSQNLNFYWQISYNMSLKRNNKMFDGSLATQASERERKSQALIFDIANREAQVSKDYLDFSLQGIKATQIGELLEQKYKDMGYEGVNDYVTSGARKLAWELGLPPAYSSNALKRSSGKDVASFYQNLYNLNIESMNRDQSLQPTRDFWEYLGRDVTRVVNWYRTAQNLWQIGLWFSTNTLYNIANYDLRAAAWRGFDPIGVLWEADMVKLQNVDFTENGVNVWSKAFNTFWSVSKEMWALLIQLAALRGLWGVVSLGLPSRTPWYMISSVAWRSALKHNTMIWLGNIGRWIKTSFLVDQNINFNSTSKDADIDVFGDMIGWMFEVVWGIKGFYTWPGVFNLSTKGSIFTFSKMIDDYAIDFGTQTARRNLAYELIAETPTLTMNEALKRVDEDPVLQRRVQERSAYVSEQEIRDMIKGVNSLEAAITRFAEIDPDGTNALLKAEYVGSVQQRIQMVAETLRLNPDTPGKIRYIQELQKLVTDKNVNIADLIRVDQKVDATVMYWPYVSARPKGSWQAALDYIQKNVEWAYIVNPFVESALRSRVGRAFEVEGIYSEVEARQIADLITNRWGGRNIDTVLTDSFDDVWTGLRLNAQGREWLGIDENLDTASRIARDTNSAESFVEWVIREALRTGEMSEATLRDIESSGAYEIVADVFSKIGC
jgi:hypothetical protein